MAETSVPESFQIWCNKLCFFCFIIFNPSLSLGSLLFHSCFFSTLERPLKFFHFFSRCSVLFYSKTTPSDANLGLECCDVIFSGEYKSRKAESVVETPFSFCRALVKRIGVFIFHPFWKYWMWKMLIKQTDNFSFELFSTSNIILFNTIEIFSSCSLFSCLKPEIYISISVS